LLPGLFKILGKTSKQTVDRWAKDYLRSNYDYTVLAPQWGNRKGQRKVTDDEFNSLLSFGLHPNRLRLSEVTRLTKMSLQKRNLESSSSEATLRRALQDWVKTHYDQWVFCREGENALKNKCLPYLERDAGIIPLSFMIRKFCENYSCLMVRNCLALDSWYSNRFKASSLIVIPSPGAVGSLKQPSTISKGFSKIAFPGSV
jgi:hypothetical protein